MCTCKHGDDRHYLDYAGPGICGGILGRCLEKDCPCTKFEKGGDFVVFPPGVTFHPVSSGVIIPSNTVVIPSGFYIT